MPSLAPKNSPTTAPTSAKLKLTCRLARIYDAAGGIELTVENDGPGIPTEAMARTFERFYRVAQDSEGISLGSAIV